MLRRNLCDIDSEVSINMISINMINMISLMNLQTIKAHILKITVFFFFKIRTNNLKKYLDTPGLVAACGFFCSGTWASQGACLLSSCGAEAQLPCGMWDLSFPTKD